MPVNKNHVVRPVKYSLARPGKIHSWPVPKHIMNLYGVNFHVIHGAHNDHVECSCIGQIIRPCPFGVKFMSVAHSQTENDENKPGRSEVTSERPDWPTKNPSPL
jgi:hypothetical protein